MQKTTLGQQGGSVIDEVLKERKWRVRGIGNIEKSIYIKNTNKLEQTFSSR